MELSGRGTHQMAALRAGSTWPAARIEQGTGPHLHIRKILAIQLGFPPAQYNHAASSPGLHCPDVL